MRLRFVNRFNKRKTKKNDGPVHDVREFAAAVGQQLSTALLDAGHSFRFVDVVHRRALGARRFRLRPIVIASIGQRHIPFNVFVKPVQQSAENVRKLLRGRVI